MQICCRFHCFHSPCVHSCQHCVAWILSCLLCFVACRATMKHWKSMKISKKSNRIIENPYKWSGKSIEIHPEVVVSTSRLLRILGKLLKTHKIHLNLEKIHENLTKSNRITENPWKWWGKSIEIHFDLVVSTSRLLRILRKLLKTYKIHLNLEKIHENLTKSNRIIENPWKW
jgi:hypothetical protein